MVRKLSVPPVCAFCNKNVGDQRGHVIPKCLYPRSNVVPHIKVPSCKQCEQLYAKCEPVFRNVVIYAGENMYQDRQEQLDTVQRSFNEKDGVAQRNKLISKVKHVLVNGQLLTKIYPLEYYEVLVVLTKIASGLSYYHQRTPVLAVETVRVVNDITWVKDFNSVHYTNEVPNDIPDWHWVDIPSVIKYLRFNVPDEKLTGFVMLFPAGAAFSVFHAYA